MKSDRPVIAVTAGDPAGIGPELAVRAAADPRFAGRVKFRLYGDRRGFGALRQTRL